jgi:hypothetical protein
MASDADAGRTDQTPGRSEAGGGRGEELVSLLLRTPSSLKELLLELPLSATLADLQRLITDKYEGRPDASRQTVRAFVSMPKRKGRGEGHLG